MTILGLYAPADDTITTYYPTEVQDRYPLVTYWHEYYHHVLTSNTDMGILDTLCCGAAIKARPESVHRIHALIDGLLAMSFCTHEGTATYLSLFFGLRTSPTAPEEVFAALPEEYRYAVDMLSPPFPTIDNLCLDSLLVHQSLLLGCARVALSLPGLEDFGKHRPVTWDFLMRFLLGHKTDERFQRILKMVQQPHVFAQLMGLVRDFACDMWKITGSDWLSQVSERASQADEPEARAFWDRLAVGIDTKIHDLCRDLGSHVDRKRRADALANLVRVCNADLCADFPGGLFERVEIRAGSDQTPKARMLPPEPGEDSWVFASIGYQRIEFQELVLALQMLRQARQLGADLWFQGKVFINPLAQELPLSEALALPPLHTSLAFVPWRPPGQEERSTRAKFVGPLCGSASYIVLPNSGVRDVLDALEGTEVLWHIDWIMYECGIRAGLNVAQWTGLKLVPCDNADSEVFQEHIRSLAHDSQVCLYAKRYRKGSVLVLVAYQIGSLLRWSLASPEPIIADIIANLVKEPGVTFMGNEEGDRIELNLKADISLIFQYGL